MSLSIRVLIPLNCISQVYSELVIGPLPYPGEVKNCLNCWVRPLQAANCGRAMRGIGITNAGITERPETSA